MFSRQSLRATSSGNDSDNPQTSLLLFLFPFSKVSKNFRSKDLRNYQRYAKTWAHKFHFYFSQLVANFNTLISNRFFLQINDLLLLSGHKSPAVPHCDLNISDFTDKIGKILQLQRHNITLGVHRSSVIVFRSYLRPKPRQRHSLSTQKMVE